MTGLMTLDDSVASPRRSGLIERPLSISLSCPHPSSVLATRDSSRRRYVDSAYLTAEGRDTPPASHHAGCPRERGAEGPGLTHPVTGAD